MTVTFGILGLDFCVLAYWGSAALLLSLESFYNYARGHCKAARGFARVVRARLEVGFVSACSWLALISCVGGCVLAEVEIGVLSCIFLYFCGC